MENRRENLKRLIALYRKHLANCVTADLATIYLNEIAKAEVELELLDKKDADKPK